MDKSQTHFEVFLRRNPKAEWKLVDAFESREKALHRAKGLVREHPHGGARVFKEALAGGNYNGVLVAHFGDCDEAKKKKSRLDLANNPAACLSGADLFRSNARKTIQEVMAPFLSRYRLLPVELTHRPDMVERLEATGHEITQGIQKVAIARSDGTNLHARVRETRDLVDQAIALLFKQAKKDTLTAYEPGAFRELASRVHGHKSAEFHLNYTVADALKSCTRWDTKLDRLHSLWAEIKDLPAGPRDLPHEVLRSAMDEWLSSPHALKDVTERASDPGEAVDWIVEVMEDVPELRADSLTALRKAAESDFFPGAKRFLLGKVFSELASRKRLRPSSLEAEVELLRDLGDRLVRLIDPSDYRAMIEAFEERSQGLTTVDTVEEFLICVDPAERPMRLFAFEQNLVGRTAKSRLLAIVRAEITNVRFERALVRSGAPASERLKALADLQEKILTSGLEEAEVLGAAIDLDALGMRLIQETGVVAKLMKSAGPVPERAAALFKLAAEGVPQGESALYAANAGLKLLKSVDGQTDLEQRPETRPLLRQLSQQAFDAGKVAVAS